MREPGWLGSEGGELCASAMVARQTAVLSHLARRHLAIPEDDISPDWRQLLVVEPHGGDQRDAQHAALLGLPHPLQPVVGCLGPAELCEEKLN